MSVEAPPSAAPPAAPSSLRAKIAAARQVESEQYRSDVWDVTLELRGILLGARSRLMADGYTNAKEPQPIYEKFYPLLLRAGCFDPATGAPVFAEADDDFINALNPTEVDRVAKILMRLSGLSQESEAALGNGSGRTPSSASVSPLPSNSGKRSRS